MQKLTKAEEEIMQIIWTLGPCLVAQIRKYIKEELGQPEPPHSTVSTLVRSLQDKGFVSYKAYGRTHEYFPVVKKEDYSKLRLDTLVSNYFDGSMKRLVSFIVKENDLSVKELTELLDKLEEE
ncbi:MAG: BlaI/MecI/CopY family transcriptional regulator [Saprospiraceae bacterium]